MSVDIRRQVQGFTLGIGRQSGSATPEITGIPQVPVLLEDLIIQSSQSLGLVTKLTVSGQPLFASDKDCDMNMWHRAAQVEGQRSLMIPVAAQQQVTVGATLAAAGVFAAAIGTAPIEADQVVPTNELGDALTYAFGLGTVNALAAATGSLTATCRKPCQLGRLVLTASIADQITVRSIVVNNIELLSGQSGSADEVAVETYRYDATDRDGNELQFPVDLNGNVTIACFNNDAVARDVYGGIFVAPRVSIGE
jgi:hypothetical protein